MRAAAEAAGYEVSEQTDPQSPDDVVTLVTRVLDDETMDPAERDRIGLEVMAAITRAMQRRQSNG